MSTKKFALVLALAVSGLGATVAPTVSEARVSAEISIQVPPPPARYEALPPPRRGYVWVPGYWNWHGHRHVWVGGNWVRARHGYAYSPHRWEQRDGRWNLAPGRWDRDGDGVPDNRDRHPNNPYRQ
jgi:hypothetical protein